MPVVPTFDHMGDSQIFKQAFIHIHQLEKGVLDNLESGHITLFQVHNTAFGLILGVGEIVKKALM